MLAQMFVDEFQIDHKAEHQYLNYDCSYCLWEKKQVYDMRKGLKVPAGVGEDSSFWW